MTDKVLVLDNNTSTKILLWAADAEEAVRRDPARYSHLSKNPPPPKNPGGRGF